MLRVLESELSFVVKSGYIYLQLMLDPEVEMEVEELYRSGGRSDPIQFLTPEVCIDRDGMSFIKSLSIQSILDNYDRLDMESYEQIRTKILPRHIIDTNLEVIVPQGKLQTILLRIMPYFIRKNKGAERKRFDDEDMLDFLSDRVDLPPSFLERADRFVDTEPLLEALRELDRMNVTVEPLEEGPVPGDTLRRWIGRAVEARIVHREKERLAKEVSRREQIGGRKRKHIATLLYIAEKGSFEIDGFGFSRVGSRDDYFIYKHTGEYVLQDYYAQSYRFPDCRVAVSTAGPLRPLVLERYKHPFLFGHVSKQEICMTGYDWPTEFTAANVIRVLEDGINALLFGYDARLRNGYHSLDRTLYYVKTIEFMDYRI